MKKIRDTAVILVFFSFLFCICRFFQPVQTDFVSAGNESTGENTEKPLYNIDHKTVTIPNLTESYKILFVNDLHIIVPNEEIASDKLEEVKNRQIGFSTPDGMLSSDYWMQLAAQLDSEKADAIIFNGDMVDYMSDANYQCLEKGLALLKTPYMFLRADHDAGTWYSNYSKKQKAEVRQKMKNLNPIETIETDQIILAGINMSTSQITPKGAAALKEIFAKGKPVILATHVPLNSLVDDTLYNASLQAWGDRALVWGKNCTYEPNADTQEYLNLVCGSDSPVAAVIGAHLHFADSTMLTDRIPQFVFDAAYKGIVGELTVSP